MLGFGANLTGFSFVNYFARSGDNMLIGWGWGDVALGYYERAYKLMMAPMQQINVPLMTLMIPALSRLNNQPVKYREAYFRAVSVLQVLSCPLMAFVAVMAPQIVQVVFGPGYEHAGPILRWLAIAGFIQPLANSLGWLYISQGRGRELMRWGLLGCSLTVLSFVVGLPWGPLGVAQSYAAMICLVVAPLAFWFAGAKGPVRVANLWRLCGEAAILATPTIGISALVSLRSEQFSDMLAIAVAALGSLTASGIAIVSTKAGRSFLGNMRGIIRSAFAKPRNA